MKEGQIKHSHKLYTAWNWKQEVSDMNKASDEGWQLMKGGCFGSKFRYDPSIRYRYQLDYPGKMADKARYLETFREQGWEYINETFNGWYYFRKVYDEKADPVEYEIFTDHDSRMSIANRWGNFALVFAVIFGLMALIRVVQMVIQPCWPTLVHMLTMVITAGFFIRGVLLIRRSAKGNTIPYDTWKFSLFLALLVVGTVGWVVLDDMRPNTTAKSHMEQTEVIPANLEEAVNWCSFDVRYTDNYYLDLELEADQPLTITLTDDDKNILYTATGTDIEEDDLRFRLQKGNYTICLSDFPGGSFEIETKLD